MFWGQNMVVSHLTRTRLMRHTRARTYTPGAASSTALLAVLVSLCCHSPGGVSGTWHEDELDLTGGEGTSSAGRRLQENVPSLSFVSFGDWGIAGKTADGEVAFLPACRRDKTVYTTRLFAARRPCFAVVGEESSTPAPSRMNPLMHPGK